MVQVFRNLASWSLSCLISNTTTILQILELSSVGLACLLLQSFFLEFPDQGERSCFDYYRCFSRPRSHFFARKVVATELVNAMMLAPVVA